MFQYGEHVQGRGFVGKWARTADFIISGDSIRKQEIARSSQPYARSRARAAIDVKLLSRTYICVTFMRIVVFYYFNYISQTSFNGLCFRSKFPTVMIEPGPLDSQEPKSAWSATAVTYDGARLAEGRGRPALWHDTRSLQRSLVATATLDRSANQSSSSLH